VDTLIDLGKIPLVNNLCDTAEDSLDAEEFPLKLLIEDDLTIFLDTKIDPAKMFSNYLYRSTINVPYIEHCKKMWHGIKSMLPEKPTIIDIGGNDGALLDAFRSASDGEMEMHNFDACADFEEDNRAKGIEFHSGFWGEERLEIGADCITSTNVFQHNNDAERFVSAISGSMHGIWVLEFPYFLTTAKTLQFDQAYHEHYYYWLVKPLSILFSKYGLSIVSISEHDIHGGTIRLVSSNKKEIVDLYCEEGMDHCDDVQAYINIEESFDFGEWGNQVRKKIDSDRVFLEKICSEYSVAAFGAAAKGCTYLSCIDSDILDNSIRYVVDDTKHKQNKFIPGTGIKIVPRDLLIQDQPEYLIVLAHNFAEYVAESLKGEYTGKIISMFPEVKFH